jgi:hypothetical protein
MGESIMFLIDDMHAVNWQHVSKSPQWVPEVEKIEPSMPTIGRFGEDFSLNGSIGHGIESRVVVDQQENHFTIEKIQRPET